METLNGKQAIENRYELVLLLEVVDGNPNGDPDADNQPRQDLETGEGLITDVCIKRKVRNYFELTHAGQPGYDIYVKHHGILVDEQKKAVKEAGDSIHKRREYMCANYFDIRAFGAVMNVGKEDENAGGGEEKETPASKNKKRSESKVVFSCGQVTGPVQVSFGRSIGPVAPVRHAITRCAQTDVDPKGVKTMVDDGKNVTVHGTMGDKWTVPYGLYRMHVSVSPMLAARTGFSDEDMQKLLEALQFMFACDQSATRGQMRTRGLYVFQHQPADQTADGKRAAQLGRAPDYRVFESLQVKLKDPSKPPRSYDDYSVAIGSVPDGVKLHVLRGASTEAAAV